jgi:predicted nucleotidyltransferase
MLSPSEIERRLRELLAEAPASYQAAYLFGSQARGNAREDSDVDVGFWRSAPSAPTLDDQPYLYADELGATLGKQVELVELNKASPDLVHEVLSQGTILLDRDPEARIAHEVRARRDYLDLRPHLLRYRRLRVDP